MQRVVNEASPCYPTVCGKASAIDTGRAHTSQHLPTPCAHTPHTHSLRTLSL